MFHILYKIENKQRRFQITRCQRTVGLRRSNQRVNPEHRWLSSCWLQYLGSGSINVLCEMLMSWGDVWLTDGSWSSDWYVV